MEAALYASRRSKRGHRRIEEPDWASVHRELKRKHVTLHPLGRVHRREPGGLQLLAVLRALSGLREDAVGDDAADPRRRERLFVDYAGDGVPVVIDRLTGEIRMAQIFVAVLGASRGVTC